ncbi:hypothetical protein MiHa_03433 [Microcystis aeruginosa NIES-2522]|nr:hypothetical protein MiHa_03433 [Microcystis aeruginosa NIES-2522]
MREFLPYRKARDYKILSELIVDDAIVKPSTGDHGKKQVILTETDDKNSYSVKIHSIPDTVSVFVVKSDIFPPPKAIFKNNKNECKRADYILLVEQEEGKYQGKYVIFLELKSGKDSNSDIIAQLKCSLGLFKYCRTIGKIFWEEEDFLKDYKFCFVTIKNIPAHRQRLNKKPTRIDKESLLKSESIESSLSWIPRKLIIFCYQNEFYFNQFFHGILT